MEPLQREQIPEHEFTVFISGEKESVFNDECTDSMIRRSGRQPTSVQAVDVNRMNVSAVTWWESEIGLPSTELVYFPNFFHNKANKNDSSL